MRRLQGTYQKGGRVDVNGFNNGELLFDLPDSTPGPMELHLDPVADAPVLALKGGHQSPEEGNRGAG